MLTRVMVGAVCAAAVAWAGQAFATVYEVTLDGVIKDQLNAGVDPRFSVGDTITLTARFDDASFVDYGDGTLIAGVDSLPTSGSSFWRIDAGGLVYSATMEQNDGPTIFTYNSKIIDADGVVHLDSKDLKGSPIYFDSDHVLGVYGKFVGPSTNPILTLGGPVAGLGGFEYVSNSYPGEAPSTILSKYIVPETGFTITSGEGLYGNTSTTPGFSGVWDFAHSTVQLVSAVPEPNTWALLIFGFGAMGAALRLQKRTAAVRSAETLPPATGRPPQYRS